MPTVTLILSLPTATFVLLAIATHARHVSHGGEGYVELCRAMRCGGRPITSAYRMLTRALKQDWLRNDRQVCGRKGAG